MNDQGYYYDMNMKERWPSCKAGQLDFVKDLVLCNDLIDKYLRMAIAEFNNWCSERGVALPLRPEVSFDAHPCNCIVEWPTYIYFDKRPRSTKLYYALSTVGKLLPRSEICTVLHCELYGIYAQRTWYSSVQKGYYYYVYVPSEEKKHNLSVYCPRLLSKYPQPKDVILPKYSAPVNAKGTRWAC